MSEYSVDVRWTRDGALFTDNRYSRRHHILFDGGVEVEASSSPHNVPVPFSVAEAVDPEEAFVAALSSCHLLSFLYIVAKRGFVVDSYTDTPVGVLAKNSAGRFAMTVVTLRPRVTFTGERRPSALEHEAMHHAAHDECYIANSVRTDVRCEATDISAPVT